MREPRTTNAMNEWGFICKDIFLGLGKLQQVINLKQGADGQSWLGASGMDSTFYPHDTISWRYRQYARARSENCGISYLIKFVQKERHDQL
jgi:hypothetical protein